MPVSDHEISVSKKFFTPRPIGDISDAEKLAYFDECRAFALRALADRRNIIALHREAFELLLLSVGPQQEIDKVFEGVATFVESAEKVTEEIEKLKPPRK